MSHQIIRQPNGEYAIFSTILDDFILTNVSPQKIVNFYVEDCRKTKNYEVARVIVSLNKGEEPYAQFTLSYQEALRIINKKKVK